MTKCHDLLLIVELSDGFHIMEEIRDGYLDGQIVLNCPNCKDYPSTRLAAYYSRDYKIVTQLKIKRRVDITDFF